MSTASIIYIYFPMLEKITLNVKASNDVADAVGKINTHPLMKCHRPVDSWIKSPYRLSFNTIRASQVKLE